MYGAVASTAMDGEAAAAAGELLRALEEQGRELDAVLSRFTEARLLLPASTEHGWRGLAQLFYSWALDRLRADLDAAHEQLTAAVHETRRAVHSLGDRVG